MNLKLFCVLINLLFMQISGIAQDKLSIKFGKITPADFDLSKYKFDSSASAVVIADIGNSVFEGNNKSFFSIVFTRHFRAKLINNKGIDIATVEIPLYTNGKDEEKLVSLKASAYNLENGIVKETKLESSSIFTEKAQKNWVIKKFTFPAVKEGTIIEYSYSQSSDFLFDLQSWTFQGKYPKLWSEYEVTIPEYFTYVTLAQGYLPYDIKTSKSTLEHYHVNINRGAESSIKQDMEGNAYTTRYVIKNVPALKEESFTTTLQNYVQKIEFQLSNERFFDYNIYEDVMGSWPKLNEELMQNEKFGLDIDKNNGWLSDDIKTITQGAKTKAEKAKKIFAFVRDKFACTSHSRLYMDNNLKTVFKNKSGSEAELNLLLAAMLNHEDIPAMPVILSTRDHGKTNEIYPLLNRFNYVVCAVQIDSMLYYLDASDPHLGFGYLPGYCYNGHARMLTKDMPQPVYLDADSLKEGKITNVFIVPDEKQKDVLAGSFKSDFGYTESYELRNKLVKKSENDFFKEIKSNYAFENMELSNTGIDSLKDPDFPVTMHYDFSVKNFFSDDFVYFNPMMSEAYKNNPLSAAERKYPVEMPYTMDEIYIFNMQAPVGYTIDEIPKPVKVLFNDTEGFFEYLTAKDDTRVQLRSRIKLNRANFSPDDYNALRDFFAFIVKKQSEQIVFKKKK